MVYRIRTDRHFMGMVMDRRYRIAYTYDKNNYADVHRRFGGKLIRKSNDSLYGEIELGNYLQPLKLVRYRNGMRTLNNLVETVFSGNTLNDCADYVIGREADFTGGFCVSEYIVIHRTHKYSRLKLTASNTEPDFGGEVEVANFNMQYSITNYSTYSYGHSPTADDYTNDIGQAVIGVWVYMLYKGWPRLVYMELKGEALYGFIYRGNALFNKKSATILVCSILNNLIYRSNSDNFVLGHIRELIEQSEPILPGLRRYKDYLISTCNGIPIEAESMHRADCARFSTVCEFIRSAIPPHIKIRMWGDDDGINVVADSVKVRRKIAYDKD